jgi:hypothetical protein
VSAAGWVHIAWACLAVTVALGLAAPVMRRRDATFARKQAYLDEMAREVRRRDRLRDERGCGAEIAPMLPAETEAFAGIAARVRFDDGLAAQLQSEINEEEAA